MIHKGVDEVIHEAFTSEVKGVDETVATKLQVCRRDRGRCRWEIDERGRQVAWGRRGSVSDAGYSYTFIFRIPTPCARPRAYHVS